jgi:hypothetical protein
MLYRLEKLLMNVNHIGLRTYFQTLELILRALSRNNFIILLFIPIIFKNFMKISIFRFYMTIETKTNIYTQK